MKTNDLPQSWVSMMILVCISFTAWAEKGLESKEELFEGPEYLKAFKNPQDNPELPNVLLIGDSISNAYTVGLRT